ncbi:Gfo/Idh/MocA family oxidoreductase [Hymenobacter sp. UV11]|uniref:Gfo/Idh/MocA family protein n=1 Tax=Hymenobacter sp. UV11 TaxID=1849735 RepID=UPI00105D5E1C|nr:Gfo/Idh/MocA family oxidoreductase [Hymenobacter sp. UV11]TDN39752.1 glucose-fructose oxidoreductase [Hymenobacter sp. UV11]TFZ67129.1 Gfo/Idh/MocA family oxidoreductase [Hymenobacter sp. UV11]
MTDLLTPTPSSRRDFLRTLSLGAGATLAGTAALGAPLDWLAPERKLGVALVGLGNYSTGQLAPALQQTKYCQLAGVVTGSPEKAVKWQQQYGIAAKNCYDYKTFDRMMDNPAIDIVYVVLPNALHAEYVVRAAQAGKHVICEKPMATSVADAKHMIAAMEKAGKKLSIGYRLHFEPHNQEMMRLGQSQAYGKINHLAADNGFKFGSGGTPWRVNKKLSGGGPLMDMGIYCLQGCLYTKGQVPVSVTAKFAPNSNPALFKDVEAGISWQLRFADGTVADCRTSYTENMSRLRADAAQGWFELEPAFGYGGLAGKTSKNDGKLNLPNINQQATQMDDFAQCVLLNKPTRVPGEMGLRDVQLLEAIYRAAETGQSVSTKDVVQLIDRRSAH